MAKLVTSLILSRIDCCNSVLLVNLPASTIALNLTQVYCNKGAGWLNEIKYIKTNQMIKVNEMKQ